MDWNEVHLIKNRKNKVLYHYPSGTLKLINESAFDLFSLLKQGKTLQQITENNSEEEKAKVISFVKRMEQSIDEIPIPSISKNNSFDRKIDRITVHVSNDCNLRCSYCYAQGGNYGMNRGLMTKETAEQFVEFCINEFEEIEYIVFFGGEPLLNVEAMQIICDMFKHYSDEGSFPLPKFGMITNGTIISSRILDFIKESITSITVSVDGPKEINDVNRIDKNGKGSYDRIAKFIHAIKDFKNLQIQYEATYTEAHVNANYKKNDIKDILREEFGIEGMVESELKNKKEDSNWTKTIKSNIEEGKLYNVPVDFWLILNEIVYKKNRIKVCPIVKSMFAVNSEGYIVACQLLNGENRNNLGNVKGDNVFSTPEMYDSFFKNTRFKEHQTCKTCWAQKLCGGCAVQRFYDKRKKEFSVIPKKTLCKKTQKYMEEALLLIADIRTNPVLWGKLIEYMKTV